MVFVIVQFGEYGFYAVSISDSRPWVDSTPGCRKGRQKSDLKVKESQIKKKLVEALEIVSVIIASVVQALAKKMSVPDRLAPESFIPSKVAPERTASVRLDLCILAPDRLA